MKMKPIILCLLLAGCIDAETTKRKQSHNYTCTDKQFERVERRVKLCQKDGKFSQPTMGCSDYSIIAVCDFKYEKADR